MRTYDDYWSRQAAPTVYNGTNDDLQREKRMNNWQRSYQLPSMIGDAVQSAMLNNPYDRSAALRAELAQQSANSVNLPWRTKEALAAELFKASPINATSGDGAAPGQRPLSSNPRTATQSAGPVAARGVVNGQELAVPTAGNYVNGAFSAEMNRVGVGQSPSFNDYSRAAYNAQPQVAEERVRNNQMRSNEKVADTQAAGRVNAAAAKPGKGETEAALRKLMEMDDKEGVESTKELYGGFQRYISDFQKAQAQPGADPAAKPLTFEEWSTKDPGAQAIQRKWQAIGQASGRTRREESAVRGGYDMAASLAGAGIQAAGGLAKSTVHDDIKRRVAELKAQNMTPEQILEHARAHGVTGQELAIVQQEVEDKKIRRAQYGSPAKPKKKQGKVLRENMSGSATVGDVTSTAGAAGVAAPASILDELIRRVQSTQINPYMSVPRYSASSPIS